MYCHILFHYILECRFCSQTLNAFGLDIQFVPFTWVLYNNWGYFHILEISAASKIQSSWRPIQLPRGKQQEVSGVLSRQQSINTLQFHLVSMIRIVSQV